MELGESAKSRDSLSDTFSFNVCIMGFLFFDDDSQYVSHLRVCFYVFVFAFLKAKRKSRWGVGSNQRSIETSTCVSLDSAIRTHPMFEV